MAKIIENFSNEELVQAINNHPILAKSKDDMMNRLLFDDIWALSYEMECRIYFKHEINSDIKSMSYGDFSLELRDTLITCLERYDPEIGRFTNYLNFCFSTKLKGKSKDKTDYVEKDRDEEKAINDYLRWVGYTFCDREVNIGLIKNIAKDLEMSPLRVEKVFLKKINRTVVSEFIKINEKDFLNLIDESCYTPGADDDYIERKEVIETFIKDAQYVFDTICQSQKEIVKMCFTADLCKGTLSLEDQDLHNYGIISSYVLNHFEQTGEILTQDQIAEKLGKLPPAVSRVYNSFKKKLKKYRDKMGR